MTDFAQLHRDAVVVDCHNDLILLAARDRMLGKSDPFRSRWIPELRAGGVDVQVVPVFVENEFLPEGAVRRTLSLMQLLNEEIERNPDDAALCLTGDEIRSAVAAGKVAFVLAFEGSAALGGQPELIDVFFRLGLRMASFTWMGRTLLADGSAEDAIAGRLTRAGVATLERMERLGILMDVSHLSAVGVEHVLEIARRPLIASHSSARALCEHHRNLTDDQLRAIAATGGVIGVNFFPGFVDPGNPTLDRLADHFEHIASVAGIDHVGVGPDFVKDYFDEMFPNHPDLMVEGLQAGQIIEGMRGPRDLPNLTAKLGERGFSEEDLRKILGENFLRVFDEVMGVPGA